MVQRTQPSPFKGQTRQGITREMERLDAFSWQLRMQGYSLREIGTALDSSLGVANARIRRHKPPPWAGCTIRQPPLRIGSAIPTDQGDKRQEALSTLAGWGIGADAVWQGNTAVAYQTLSRLYRGTIRAWALEGPL